MTRLLAVMVTALMLAPAGFAAPAHGDRITQSRGATVRAAADKAFDAAYNLNYEEAMRLARQLVAAHPDESAAHRALATVVWMHLLFDRGAFTIDHYLGSVTQSNIQLPPPPVERAQLFRLHVNRAIALADARLQRAPDDVEARYDLGVAHGLLASYIGTVDGKIASAFGSARLAYDAHEKVLHRDPTRLDAGLIVGTYRYAVAAMSLPKRWLAYIAGFGGGKKRGIEMLVGATKAPLTATDARMALVLVYSREARQHDAFTLLTALMKEYPENRLLQLEAASAAWRAGRADQSEQLLTTGLARHDRDPRPKGPGERALWIYKRGMARVSLNRLGDATSDLQLALTQGPAGWVRGRVHLELGKIADLRGQRPAALEEYTRARTLCTTHQDPWCREQADNFRKRPFRFQD
jgi:tetratricopeptide (TPR) repeat protein